MDAGASINVCGIVDGTSVDGPGLRTSVYFAGCGHNCPGCHNAHTWPFDAGERMFLTDILARIDDNGLDVTFSGGDPIYSAAALAPLAHEIRKRGFGLWLYTGFTFEQLQDMADKDVNELLGYVDVLVDGPYIENLRDTSLLFRGSSNQRLIDMAATRAKGAVVLYHSDF